jgi:tRNA(Ile)-lysidine synthase
VIEALRQLPKTHAVTRSYLIGVSGGVDSVVLLRLLHQLGYRKLIVVHLNHALRGRASGADATFVRRLATTLGYDAEIRREDVAKQAVTDKQSIETAARNARHAFFADVAKRRRCQTLFLGHHADDQIETVLMNLFRGTGSAGLGGIRETSTQTINGVRLEIIRPLLATSREELLAYAIEEKIRFREDASNTDRKFLRNRVRHDLLPQLTEIFGRDIRPAIHRLATQCQSESTYFDERIQEDADQATLSVAHLRKLPLALQRRLIHRWLHSQNISNIDFDLVESTLRLIEEDANVAKINLPRDRHLRRRKGVLFVE